MDVVFEDYRTLVFLFGGRHLDARSQEESETSLSDAPTVLLP